MKTVIFYFTGTGNSLAAARKIAADLKDARVISMTAPDALRAAEDADRVGFVFPVYDFSPPIIVDKFLRQVSLPPGVPIFVVATCGGLGLGTVGMIRSILRKRGSKLTVGFNLPMVNNYIPMVIPSENKQRKKLAKADARLDKIIARITSGRDEVHGTFFPAHWISIVLFKTISVPLMANLDKSFFSDSNCDGCGICARVCPVKNIELADKRPRWLHRCEQCWGCLHWCPKKAIQYGKGSVGKRRYHHPDVKLSDLVPC
jgi:Pyruvate/2-oxoacid:ferredoxin oxidoreductase delta subunit/flavodoxin